MRGSQFLTLVQMLRDELRRSTDPAISSSDIDGLKRVINRNYESIYLDYDWPVLRSVYPSRAMSAGQYLYDLPEDLDAERIEKVSVWYAALPYELTRGIGFDQYRIYDTEDDERSAPIRHWDLRAEGNTVMYEVWPVPDSTIQYVQFIGFKKFARLVDDLDQCLLDDNLIVAFAAAELLVAQGSEDAEAKLKAAQTLYGRLRGRLRAAAKTYTLNEGGIGPKPAPKIVVAVSR